MTVKVKKLDDRAKLPSFAHDDDAGMDLFCIEDLAIKPGEISGVKTGIAIELPKDTVGLIWDKSGLALKTGIKTMGGVIDAGYRGEVVVICTNLSQAEYTLKAGDKIAQILIQKVEHPEVVEQDLNDTDRGNNGFGSTGK